MTTDAPERIQNIMATAMQQLEAEGLTTVNALHHLVSFALATLPAVVCPCCLAEELAYIDDALAQLRADAAAGVN